jgi:tetratricopeptide (TPR) repeat protein
MSPRIFVICIFVLSAAICGAVNLSFASPPQTAGQARSSAIDIGHETLLVFPFENESRMANLDWLGEGLSELTAERVEDRHVYVYVLSRLDRLATLERMGLPDSAQFSHASMVKIATEADADAIIYGRFQSDGKTATLVARVLRLNPPSLSPLLTETSNMQDLLRAHARLTWQILCALAKKNCLPQGANRDESSFSEPPTTLRLDALENFVRGVSASGDEERLRLLREAARLEPAWDRPAFELGQIYSARHDCDQALLWYSRVPPNRPDGPEASFATGVCHLSRNDAARAEASFSGLLDRTRKHGEVDALPELPEMHNNLGVARFRLGKWTDAGAEFERATALDPEEADYHVNLGLARLAAKQPASAATEFEHALKIDPDDKELRALQVSTLEFLGRSSEAAAIRSEAAQNSGKTTPPNIQDAPGLARMARISRTLDRTLLRPASEAPESQAPAGQGTHNTGGSEARQ